MRQRGPWSASLGGKNNHLALTYRATIREQLLHDAVANRSCSEAPAVGGANDRTEL